MMLVFHLLADLAVWTVLSMALGCFVGGCIRVGGSTHG